MFVVKRSGIKEEVKFDKITRRIQSLCFGLSDHVDPIRVAQKVVKHIKSGMTTVELDKLSARTSANMCTDHPDYSILAGRIEVSNLHKQTKKSFSETMSLVHEINSKLVDSDVLSLILEHRDVLDSSIQHIRSYNYNYFGFKTLEKSYLLKDSGIVVERPQCMLMRTAVEVNITEVDGKLTLDVNNAIHTYNLLSEGFYTHATPTLFNSCSEKRQLSSCFLLGTEDCVGLDEDDRHEGIFKTISDVANISKWTGGIGVHISNIRATDTPIAGTGGISDGLIPMLRVYNATLRYMTQGGKKRKGSGAFYLEPWHADIFEFLDLKKNTGDEELRCRDIHLALWMPDIFMKRVKEEGVWSLMCPHKCPGLTDTYGEEFEELYERYEKEGKFNRQVKAQDLWFKILESQMEFGEPYIMYKDSVNRKSNQKNLGIIRSSNLCVSGDTLVTTDKGLTPIKDLENTKVNVWNGEEWSEVLVTKTGTNVDLIRLTFDSTVIDCTPEHKFYVYKTTDVYSDDDEIMEVRASEMLPGYELEEWKDPDGNWNSAIFIREDKGPTCDTFCFTEPKRHRGMFNGIVTGQCSEIVQYSDSQEYGVCNLASIALPKFVKSGKFDFDSLIKVVHSAVANLDRVIDRNFYPVPETKRSNLRHRPIGLGVQGLADVYALMRYPFESAEARELNKQIFETIYFASLTQSCETAKKLGPYPTYEGSPISEGVFQWELWGLSKSDLSGMYDWESLRADILEHGVRNSLLVALMPTASTAQILGNNEAFEPFTNNIYKRRVLSGEFVVINKYLIQDLTDLGLWDRGMKTKLIQSYGSVQKIPEIPENIKALYKTVWEMSQKTIIDQALERGVFVDQAQSMNIWMDPTFGKLSSMHFYTWEKGAKNGMYYLRTRPATEAIQFTARSEPTESEDGIPMCTMEDGCVSCGA